MKTMSWKLGVSTASWNKNPHTKLQKEMFEAYKQGGIQCLEISVGQKEENDKINFMQTLQFSKDYGVELFSYHLPFFPYDVSCMDKQKRQQNVLALCDYINKGINIGIKIFVVHPSSLTHFGNEIEEWEKCAQDSLARLADFADKNGAVIAVENLPRDHLGNCCTSMQKLLSADERLRVCFDTNHLLLENNEKFIKEFGKKIVTLHVSDYNFLDEQHWLPYEGLNDWKKIISLLKEVGYEGPFMYEVAGVAPKTIKRRDLNYTDFKNNYLALMKGEIPELLGVINDSCEKQIYYPTKQF